MKIKKTEVSKCDPICEKCGKVNLRIYSNSCYCSIPPQYDLICEKCGYTCVGRIADTIQYDPIEKPNSINKDELMKDFDAAIAKIKAWIESEKQAMALEELSKLPVCDFNYKDKSNDFKKISYEDLENLVINALHGAREALEQKDERIKKLESKLEQANDALNTKEALLSKCERQLSDFGKIHNFLQNINIEEKDERIKKLEEEIARHRLFDRFVELCNENRINFSLNKPRYKTIEFYDLTLFGPSLRSSYSNSMGNLNLLLQQAIELLEKYREKN